MNVPVPLVVKVTDPVGTLPVRSETTVTVHVVGMLTGMVDGVQFSCVVVFLF